MAGDTHTADELESYAQGRIGTMLRGKYRIDSVIGLGGMAVVYKATHRNQAEFAVKMLHPELSIREDVRTRFIREGYAANSVKHPGVVLVVDDDVADDGAAFLVMELLDGVGCEMLWERCGGRMPLAAACSIGHQLLDVLASAHAKGIVHRDLKPANMFVTASGRVKVLDFGIARVRDVAASSATLTGMLLGTPAFMPPEQALAKTTEIDPRTDVWAVGATLFTMLSGALVHEAENAQQILIKAATQPARSLVTALPDAPKAIVELVDRALAFDKAQRWLDAAAMRDALAKACEETTGAAPSMSALAELLHRSSESGARTIDRRSEAALAQTESAQPAREAPVVHRSGGTARPVVAPAASGATMPLAALASAPVRADDSSPAPSPGVSARRLMGTSTATPVATDRPPVMASNRRALALVVASGLVVAVAVGVALGVGRWENPDPPTAATMVRVTTAPEAVATSPGAAPSTTARASVDSVEPDAVIVPERGSAEAAPRATTTPVVGPDAVANAAVAKPVVARPQLPAPRPPANASADAGSVSPKPSSASSPALPRCRTVVDHLDADGQKIFRKQCD